MGAFRWVEVRDGFRLEGERQAVVTHQNLAFAVHSPFLLDVDGHECWAFYTDERGLMVALPGGPDAFYRVTKRGYGSDLPRLPGTLTVDRYRYDWDYSDAGHLEVRVAGRLILTLRRTWRDSEVKYAWLAEWAEEPQDPSIWVALALVGPVSRLLSYACMDPLEF